jgi:hypothetical protein
VRLLLLCFLFSLYSTFSWAQGVQSGQVYKLAHGSIERIENTPVSKDTFIRVTAVQGWLVEYEVLDSNYRPVSSGNRSSKQWVDRAAQALSNEDAVKMALSVSQSADPNRPAQCCEGTAMAASLESSIRPPPRPPALRGGTSPSSNLIFKNLGSTDAYFQCYQTNQASHQQYTSRFRSSIGEVSRVYAQSMPSVSTEDAQALMGCLIFRESAHWRGGTSRTGAVGLGQFTTVAINQVKDIINYSGRDNFDERVETQRAERAAGRIRSDDDLRSRINLIEAERRNHLRMVELRRLWESYPLANRPRANQINSNYLANNDNHQAIIALSSLLMRDCQIRLQHNGINMAEKDSLVACAGAYNMGVGGFSSNALSRDGPHNVSAWVENLRRSGHSQRNETINHVISISRCVDNAGNYPPCGTQANFCSDLPRANPCQDSHRPLCIGECS